MKYYLLLFRFTVIFIFNNLQRALKLMSHY